MQRAAILLIAFTLLSAHALAEPQWYKGATHVHTLWSDGDGAPEVAAEWYKSRGWDFVCYTDHNTLLEGEKYMAIGGDKRLPQERFDELVAEFGDDWITTREVDGVQQMRLKTFEELSKRFNEPGQFLLVPAEEMTTQGGNPHMNAINLREAVPGLPNEGEKAPIMQHYVDAIRAQQKKYDVPMLVHLDHPNYHDRITTEEILQVNHLNFFEVFNGTGGVHSWGIPEEGVPSGDRHWDVILAMKQRRDPDYLMYGVATDDSHNYYGFWLGKSNPGRGWVMVRAENLEANALVKAMLRGDFYASTGVTLSDIQRDTKSLAIAIDGEEGVTYTTQYIGTRKGFDDTTRPATDAEGKPLPRSSLIYSDTIGEVLHETTALESTYTFTGDELYVRARILSDKPQPNPHAEGDKEMAWVQPVLVR